MDIYYLVRAAIDFVTYFQLGSAFRVEAALELGLGLVRVWVRIRFGVGVGITIIM